MDAHAAFGGILDIRRSLQVSRSRPILPVARCWWGGGCWQMYSHHHETLGAAGAFRCYMRVLPANPVAALLDNSPVLFAR